MGVRGLKTFIENNPGLFNNHHQLHNTSLVIDANNLVKVLYENSQKHERRDLFGGDMVQFGRHVGLFFDNLRRCKIEPILVFDGAQTYDKNKSKTAEKHRRALDRFEMVMSINKLGFGDFILPATATNVFRSVAVDKAVEMIQCMYEADAEVARISNECQCPVISNDSDFFLMDLPYGLITIDLLDYQHLITTTDSSKCSIECSLFKQTHFHRYLPDLDIRNLPLLGVLAGNDFIASQVFERICTRLPSHKGSPGANNFRKVTGNKRHEKILRILYFITGHSLNETVNLICYQVAREDRQRLKTLIRSNLEVYKIPEEDDFEKELRNLYWRGFSLTYKKSLTSNNKQELIARFNEKMRILRMWLKNAMEKSVLSYRCLELMNRNIVFIINHMDDPSLPSAHECQHRTTCVLLSLLRSTHREKNYCTLYDRFGRTYSKRRLQALEYLDNFGTLDYTFYDLPELSKSIRRSILLATFHSSERTFEFYAGQCYEWFDGDHAEEFMMVKTLFEFIDTENCQVARLWKHFRQATLLCIIYYLYREGQDRMLNERLSDDGDGDNFMTHFSHLVKREKLDKMPVLNRRRKYNCRLMHQITQLQSSIISFNGLNAFLGDVMTRLRTEHWLNSCLIYNLAEGLHNRVLRLPNIPEIVHLRPDD